MTRIYVDWRAALALVGTVLKFLAVPLVLPLLLSVYYGDGAVAFGVTIAVALTLGTGLERLDTTRDIGVREGFLVVAATWLFVSLVGALPYVIAGAGTASTLAHPVNALFESMSGFTTTGATVMGEISFDRHARSLLLWRQLTQWLGGMGIVVLAVAILPELSVGGAQLMDAEAPGPGIEKLTPRIAETARVLWGAYLAFTLLEVLLLYGLHLAGMAPNMTLYNAVAHGLTTLPTGGFSPEARSIEAFSAAVQWVIIPFMVVAGTNFALFWHALAGNFGRIGEDSEFRAYLGALGTLAAVVVVLLFTGSGFLTVAPDGGTFDASYLAATTGTVVGNLEPSARHALFQAISITTTTGYASLDFNTWSPVSQYALLFAMFIGGSAGSTGGSIKIVRWYVILKSLRRELFTTAHPNAVRPVRLNGRPLDETAIRGIYAFTLLYLVSFLVGALLLFLDSTRVGVDLSVLEIMSATAATLGNVGPGFGAVGPMGNYLVFSAPSKVFMVLLMWVGRLEIIPVLVCFTPGYWQR